MATETVINRPAPFVEDIGKSLAEQTLALQNVPVVSTGIAGLSQQAGETAAGFKARQDAARAFTTRQQNLAGPQAFQQFMSPYQQQVIDTSLAEFDRQAQAQQQTIRDQAVASGAFGGGREGVALAEYGAASDRNRAALQAGLLQQGFGQAQAAAQQNFANQMGIASALPGLQGTDITRLGQLGAINQAQKQAELDATREATRMAAFQPQEELNRFADITTGIMGGMRGTGTSTQNIPNPSPLSTALGVGSTLAGIYGYLGGRPFA